MRPWKDRSLLLWGLILLAASGWLLHLKIHPFSATVPGQGSATVLRWPYFLSNFLPLLDLVGVTLLFLRRRTAVYGYVLNGMIVIYGTVLMGHFSLAGLLREGGPVFLWLFRSTLPDIGIAWADFFAGKLLYEAWMHQA